MLTLVFMGLAMTASQERAARPKTVAMVVIWSGSPTWSDGKTTRPLGSYDRLRPGDTVAAGPGGTVTLYFIGDGHKEVVHADARLAIGPKRGTATGKVDVIESQFKIDSKATLREAIGAGKIAGSVHRGNEKPEPLITPVDGAIIVTDRPNLRWPVVEGSAGYRVTLQIAGSGKPVWVQETTSTELPYPAKATALTRAIKYRWAVTALFGMVEKPHLKERFFTVGTEDMARQAAQWQALAQSKDPTDQMLAAVGYEYLGMLDELHPLYVKITKAVTNDAKVWAIHASYAAKAGREKEAADAWKKAKQLGWQAEP